MKKLFGKKPLAFLLSATFLAAILILLGWQHPVLALVFFVLFAVMGYFILPKNVKTEAYTPPPDVYYDETRRGYGWFDYQENGFTLETREGNIYVAWDQINAVFAYKRDDYTTDCVCTDVFYGENLSFNITEDVNGWWMFQKKLAERYPQIDPDWEGKIIYPAFKTNLTLLYEKNGLAMKQAEKKYYRLWWRL